MSSRAMSGGMALMFNERKACAGTRKCRDGVAGKLVYSRHLSALAMPWGARRSLIYYVCRGPTSTAPNSEHKSCRSRWSMPHGRLLTDTLRALKSKLRVQRYSMSKL